MDISDRRLFAYCLLAAVVGFGGTMVAGVNLSGAAGGAIPFVAAVVVLAVLLFLDGLSG